MSTAMDATASGTVIYDADCGFCTNSARWLESHGSAAIQPWQTSDLDALGLTEQEVSTAVYWLGPDGRVTARAGAAVAAALMTCRGIWPYVGRLLRLPVVRDLAEVGYRVVARNRYRLPGSTDACRLDR